ncbi:MAG: hypothetical protein ACREHG_04885, partial [Candidatus Saccharimonadales bacterium]
PYYIVTEEEITAPLIIKNNGETTAEGFILNISCESFNTGYKGYHLTRKNEPTPLSCPLYLQSRALFFPFFRWSFRCSISESKQAAFPVRISRSGHI